MTKPVYGYLNQEILCQGHDQKYVKVPRYTTLAITPSQGDMLSCLMLLNSQLQPLQVRREAVTTIQPTIEGTNITETLEKLITQVKNRLI